MNDEVKHFSIQLTISLDAHKAQRLPRLLSEASNGAESVMSPDPCHRSISKL